jgi:hypothetical protein
MTWASDVALYNTAVTALGQFVIAREANTPSTDMLAKKITAQTALDAIVVPLSATITMPKQFPAGGS